MLHEIDEHSIFDKQEVINITKESDVILTSNPLPITVSFPHILTLGELVQRTLDKATSLLDQENVNQEEVKWMISEVKKNFEDNKKCFEYIKTDGNIDMNELIMNTKPKGKYCILDSFRRLANSQLAFHSLFDFHFHCPECF